MSLPEPKKRHGTRLILKIDMHVHTWYSDSNGSVDDVLDVARRKGLDGIAITDHNTINGALEALWKKTNLIVIPGEEVSTRRGEILALGIRKEVQPGLDILDTIEKIHTQGGLAIVPHPAVPFFSVFKIDELARLPIDGLEAFSSLTPYSKYFARESLEMAEKLQVGVTAGSDSHSPETVGDAYTIVNSESQSLEDILCAIKLGFTSIEGSSSRLYFKLKMVKGFLAHIL